jgi:chitosanase
VWNRRNLIKGMSLSAVALTGLFSSVSNTVSLADPAKKEIAMELVSSAENSTLDWKSQYGYIEDIKDGRGYTAGIIGFCSGTGDMLELLQYYTKIAPTNGIQRFIPALKKVNGTASHTGLSGLPTAWKQSVVNQAFKDAQNYERDRVYFNPAVNQGIADKLSVLGQFVYYDAMVMHGPGNDPLSFGGIRAAAIKVAKTPASGGDETAYLNAFFAARKKIMKKEDAHSDTSRIDTEQAVFLKNKNWNLTLPLAWKTYGDSYAIKG